MIGSTIGQYRIEAKLGEGGMGEVYRAVDTMLEREVAIKVLHRFATQDAGRLERFRSEAVTLARLNHPNIAILHNFFEVGQDYYMVMEYVQGENFESLLRRPGRLPLRTLLEWFCQALCGFEHAHARGVIHRDIKPANLMLNGEGVVKITDFGIARVVGGQRLTQTGKLIGTLEYMSPEQVRGEKQDARSDIYSLGILLHEMATEQVPFTGGSDYEVMRSHLERVPRPPRELDGTLPVEIEVAILKALAKDPADRFQTATEFRACIEPALAHLPAADAAVPIPAGSTREAAAVDFIVPPAPSPPPAPALEYSSAGAGVTRPESSVARPTLKLSAVWPPAWLTPKIALGAALSFLVLMVFIAVATTRRGTVENTVPVVESTIIQPDKFAATGEDKDEESSSFENEGGIPVVVPPPAALPNPAITPLPVVRPVPTPKPTARPTPKPTARPAPKPKPKAVAKQKTRVRPRRKPAVRRREKPKPRARKPRRSTTPRRSRPSGGGGQDVIGIIKNS